MCGLYTHHVGVIQRKAPPHIVNPMGLHELLNICVILAREESIYKMSVLNIPRTS